MTGIGEAASIIAVVQLADRIICLCGEYTLAVRGAKEYIERLTSEVKALKRVLESADKMTRIGETKLYTSESVLEVLAGSIKECNSTLSQLEIQLSPRRGRKLMKSFGMRLMWPFKSKDVAEIIEGLNRHKATITLALNLDQTKNFNLAEQDRQIDKLPLRWSENPQLACIFWLRGMAGTGKSTLARTIASSFADKKQLGASFFFSRGRGDLGYAKMFFTTIVAQLAGKVPPLRHHISKAISENPQIVREGLAEQWKHLVFKPLLCLEETLLEPDKISLGPQILMLVIDALDECEDNVQLILRLLTEAKTLKRIKLRVFITSRPETIIRVGFGKMPGDAHLDFTLHDIDNAITQQDIFLFLSHEFEEVRKEYSIEEGWPNGEIIQRLAQRANGLFIYAATACRFIRSSNYSPPEEQLELLLRSSTTSKSPDGVVDKIYMQVLEHSLIGDNDDQEREKLTLLFRAIVGPIVVLFDTLSSTALAALTDNSDQLVLAILGNLHSVLDVPSGHECPIQLLHPSFRDFLLNQARCLNSQFWIDEKVTHRDIFLRCIAVMSKHFQNQDICDLRLPGTLAVDVDESKVQNGLPAHVQYASLYWVDHLIRSNIVDNDLDKIHLFLREKLLYWLEALSLLGKVSDSIQMIVNLQSLVAGRQVALYELTRDAERFILYNRSIVGEAPLQIYYSALIFAPENCTIRKQFKNHIPSWICMLPTVQKEWSSLLQTLEGHSDTVEAVIFSPDGKLVASACCGDVTVWDLKAGAAGVVIQGHPRAIWAVAFSSDSRLVASGSEDGTIRLFNSITGAAHATLKGHFKEVATVAFSPDGKLVLSSSYDGTVRLWDIVIGAARTTLKVYNYTMVAFSPNGKLVASALSDDGVSLWDPVTGAVRTTLRGSSSHATAVAFSPDGKLILTAFCHEPLRLWGLTGTLCATFSNYGDGVTAVSALTFSPDSKLVASASQNGIVKLWDLMEASSPTFKNHADHLTAVTFSPDGKLVASASRDQTVKLWNLTGALCATLEGHLMTVTAVTFSPDGKLVASASPDRTIRLWDITTGARWSIPIHKQWAFRYWFPPAPRWC
ncbi:vegetative incompatibility protein HET-E-1 [Glonium stellatum]|uniref:Vegetative incompatibility protein HET-E-1 n=1 Tax=Glonium stellatum TaxID=574774 RepID=A0A8E2F0A8_9PEZI|nr:vegetative incompatibility protein HET-E-1 [Glonium stellatum]